MNEADKRKYIDRYVGRYNEFGFSPKTLGWGNFGRQELRFSVLSQIGIGLESSVLDVGCGFGDLFKYLKENNWDGKYFGIDIVEELLDEAKKQYSDICVQNLDILENDVEQFDFDAKLFSEDNLQYIERMMKKMFDISRVGVAIDFLSSYVDFTNEIAYHSSPEVIFSMAKRISKRIVLRHDYMPYEFAVYLYKNDDITDSNVFIK